MSDDRDYCAVGTDGAKRQFTASFQRRDLTSLVHEYPEEHDGA